MIIMENLIQEFFVKIINGHITLMMEVCSKPQECLKILTIQILDLKGEAISRLFEKGLSVSEV